VELPAATHLSFIGPGTLLLYDSALLTHLHLQTTQITSREHIPSLHNLTFLSLSDVRIFGTFGNFFHVPSVVEIELYGVIRDDDIPIDTLEAANCHLALHKSCPRSASVTILPYGPRNLD
jgi:hypothetical protein